MALIDLTGQRFGRLIVIEYNKQTKKWKCQCDCGNIKEVQSANLRRGATQSCGCLQKEKITNNLIGKTFGYLTVIEDSKERDSKRRILWNCKCQCGNIIKVRTDNLTSLNTMSCGCKKSSNKEKIIENLLKENNIQYKREYVFKDLLSPNNGYLRFDFAIFKNNILQYLIEYDGETHSLDYINGWNTKEKILYQQKCDNLKNEYCKNHKIPLIRINYLKNDITINDLTLGENNGKK